MGSFFDFLNPLFDAMAWIIVQFHAFFGLIFNPDSGAAWGLSIVLLVVAIRVCLIPLFVKQIKATRNMQVIQPEVKKLQQKYKHDKQRQQQEVMKLYKETGTNPFSSCLPILIQSPFFLALFRVLSGIANGGPLHGPFKNGPFNPNGSPAPHSLAYSAQHAKIFGAPIAATFRTSDSTIHALAANPTTVEIVIVAMIVLMSASQFITQRQLILKNTAVDSAGSNPFAKQQKMLMYIFPVMFAVFGINFPVGVLIYWLTTNVWSMGQQLVVIRRNPTPGSLAAKQREQRLAAKRAKRPPTETAETSEADSATPRPSQRQQPVRTTKSQRAAQQPKTTRAAVGDAADSGDEAAANPVQPTAKPAEAAAAAKERGGKVTASSKGRPAASGGKSQPASGKSQPAAAKGTSRGGSTAKGSGAAARRPAAKRPETGEQPKAANRAAASGAKRGGAGKPASRSDGKEDGQKNSSAGSAQVTGAAKKGK